MADNNRFPSDLTFRQQDLNYTPDSTLFSDAPSDLDYNLMFEQFRDTVNSVVYPSNYSPTDSYVGGNTGPNYNPYKENVNFSKNEIDIIKSYANSVNDIKHDPKVITPILSSKKLTDYERYYNHPMFQQLGFNPLRDNETLYNENSTVWVVFTREGDLVVSVVQEGLIRPIDGR